jgi:hypothetical protein
MSLGTILALICIILGFIVGLADVDLVFDAMSWFVAAIAIVLTLDGVNLGSFAVKRGE